MHRSNVLVIYGKEGCCLCERAFEAARRLQKQFSYEIQYVDISTRPELWERYGCSIPVLFFNGFEIMRGKVAMLWLERALKRAVGRPRL